MVSKSGSSDAVTRDTVEVLQHAGLYRYEGVDMINMGFFKVFPSVERQVFRKCFKVSIFPLLVKISFLVAIV